MRFIQIKQNTANSVCKPLIFYRVFLKGLKGTSRSRAKNDPNFKPVRYGKKTSTTTLCKHLFSISCDKTTHIDEWTTECKTRGITIVAKEAVEAIAAHQGIKSTSNIQTQSRPQFTPLRFINALTEFIVATNQV
jgi:hypothetical protein